MTSKRLLTSAMALMLLAAPINAEILTLEAAESDLDITTDRGMQPLMADASTAVGIGSDFTGLTVGDIIGMNVRGENDEIVGEIDYIIEAADGVEAVIGVGGILGMGEYTVALPLERFKFNQDDEVLVLSQFTAAELEAMPEIDESGLESLDDAIILN